MVHMDNDLDIPPKLNEWVMQITHKYLSHYDPVFLTINTHTCTWKQTRSQHQDTKTTTEGNKRWIPVLNRRGQTKSPPARVVTPSTQGIGNCHPLEGAFTSGFDLPPEECKGIAPSVQFTTTKAEKDNAQKPNHAKQTTEKLHDTTNTNENRSSQNPDSDAPPATTIPRDRPVPNPMIATNDGTHCILAVKWKLNGTEYSIKMVRDKQYLGNLLYKLMQLMFKDNDGHMYRWESEDLVNARMIFQLTVAEIRDYITPNITFVKKQCNVYFWRTFWIRY